MRVGRAEAQAGAGAGRGALGVAAALRLGRAALARAIDFALPPRCAGCGAITGSEGAFCPDCWAGLDLLGAPCCDRCAAPFEADALAGEDGLCLGCRSGPPVFDRLRAAVAYGELARGVALKLKYGRRPGAARVMANLMSRHVAVFTGAAAPILCPVPLHRSRLWQRGYNQAALIARALARRHRLELVPDLLQRTRATPPLKEMGPAERARVVRGAFRLHPRHASKVKGRPILLIDDVFTSGATVSACARVLKAGGAAHVGVLCWARVLHGD